jgi:hypothetical protein
MKARPPPKWFSLDSYPTKLDARGWLDALLRANAKLDSTWLAEKEEWRAIVGPDIENMYPGILPSPVVQLIEEPVRLHAIELPALLINLSAPDGAILDELKKALRAAREKHPSAVLKRGPQALNGRFDAQQFSTWRRYKILPFADLRAWCDQQPEKLSDAQIGRWLGFNEDRATKDVAQAREVLQRALNSIPALAAQVAAEHSGNEEPGGRQDVPKNSP